jgi:cell division protein YceG involved in septum cleavage
MQFMDQETYGSNKEKLERYAVRFPGTLTNPRRTDGAIMTKYYQVMRDRRRRQVIDEALQRGLPRIDQ